MAQSMHVSAAAGEKEVAVTGKSKASLRARPRRKNIGSRNVAAHGTF